MIPAEAEAATPRRQAAATVDISIIICTVDRFALADRTIASVLGQHIPHGTSVELIVVDNSPAGLSRERIEARAKTSPFTLRYLHERRPNISHARNAGIAASTGGLVAFLDDDTEAEPEWLCHMLDVMAGNDGDIVIGPSYPDFEGGKPPRWDRDGIYYTRDQHLPDGAEITKGATCNALIRRATCLTDDPVFDPAFGRTGGEDSDFIARQGKRGHRILWCATGVVTEFQPLDRMTVRYRTLRFFRSSQTNVRVALSNSNNRPLTILRFTVTGLIQVVVLFVPYLLSRWFQAPVMLHARFKFVTGLGKLLWPLHRPFY
ncbi:MAG: glycosyltransferase family 2 protein [Alphaproteobacteria bacterium]